MNIFKEKRIELGLSIIEVVNEINYPISIIEAIERGELKFLSKPYLYYSVKSYGLFLKIQDLENLIIKYK